ncbi:MAG: protein translocase subunit SecF [Bdellovibrionota bacterium]
MAKTGTFNETATPAKSGKTHDYGRFNYVSLAWPMGGLSLLAMIVSVVLVFTKGMNYGIDFVGGTEIHVKFDQAVDAGALRAAVEGVGIDNPSVQTFGSENEFLIRLETPVAPTEKQTNELITQNVTKIRTALATQFSLKEEGVLRVDSVGPQVGSELKRNGFLAAFYCFLMILIYVSVRFDYKFAPGAVICLIHDAVLVIGVFSLLGREFNVQIMAAILALIGYSLNDTIVTFDRIRETYPENREKGMAWVINRAINDMMGRTLLTAFTTMLAVVALFIFGGGVISEIAFALIIGIVFGVYSSIYVAAPLILAMEKLKRKPA